MRTVYRVSAALIVLLASAAAAATDKSFERTVAAQPKGVVDISNVAGSIEVSGWDRQEVSVRAELGEDVERVDVSSEGDHTTIKVVLPQHGGGRHGEARLHVQIPKDSELDLSAVSADVEARGIQGVQHLSTVSGDLSSELAGADVEAKSVSGDIKLKGHGQPARLRVTTVSGDVHLEHGAGDLESSSVSGSLGISLDSARSVRVRSTSGDLRFEGKLTKDATFEATSVSGELNVRAAPAGGFAYEISSFSGDISNCFGAKAQRDSEYGPGSKLTGTRGDGAGHIRLKTMSGDISLCDRD
jgi:Putative adhesin